VNETCRRPSVSLVPTTTQHRDEKTATNERGKKLRDDNTHKICTSHLAVFGAIAVAPLEVVAIDCIALHPSSSSSILLLPVTTEVVDPVTTSFLPSFPRSLDRFIYLFILSTV
jgi:hypothetical protein